MFQLGAGSLLFNLLLTCSRLKLSRVEVIEENKTLQSNAAELKARVRPMLS